MTDGILLVFGCVVTFIAYAGSYVYVRERICLLYTSDAADE